MSPTAERRSCRSQERCTGVCPEGAAQPLGQNPIRGRPVEVVGVQHREGTVEMGGGGEQAVPGSPGLYSLLWYGYSIRYNINFLEHIFDFNIVFEFTNEDFSELFLNTFSNYKYNFPETSFNGI